MVPDEDLRRRARVLGDPTRFAILQRVAVAVGPASVAELTDHFGFNHNNIRQHLAELVEAGFVREFDEERSARGRPRKLYSLRPEGLQGLDVGITPYQRLADLLLDLHTGDRSAYDVGFRAGADDAIDADDVVAALTARLAAEGFEPASEGGQTIRLDVCPFASTAARDQAVVCELHRGLIDGQLSAHEAGLSVELVVAPPRDAGCVVRLQRSGD